MLEHGILQTVNCGNVTGSQMTDEFTADVQFEIYQKEIFELLSE